MHDMIRWGSYLQSCLWGFNMRKLNLKCHTQWYIVGICHYIILHNITQVVSHVDNIWIGPWANFPPIYKPNMRKLNLKCHTQWYIVGICHYIILHNITQVVSHVDNIWIGPWANFPQIYKPNLSFEKAFMNSAFILREVE